MIEIRVIQPNEKIRIDPLDDTFSYGMAFFESMKIYKGRLYYWDKHWERISGSALELFGCNLSLNDKDKVLKSISDFHRINLSTDYILKLSLTYSNRKPLIYIYKRSNFKKPESVSLCLNFDYLINENSLIKGYKTHNYFENILLKKHAERKGFYDYIRLNTKGYLCETSSANCFFISGENIITPSVASGLLSGIIRQTILDEFNIQCKALKEDDIKSIDSAFITNISFPIMPVSSISGLSNKTKLNLNVKNPLIEEIKYSLKKIALSKSINFN